MSDWCKITLTIKFIYWTRISIVLTIRIMDKMSYYLNNSITNYNHCNILISSFSTDIILIQWIHIGKVFLYQYDTDICQCFDTLRYCMYIQKNFLNGRLPTLKANHQGNSWFLACDSFSIDPFPQFLFCESLWGTDE
jgi:hypothetical protein